VDLQTLRTFDRTVTLPSGRRLRLRPIRADDAPRLLELYDRLSQQSAYQRFFTVMQRLPPDWARLLAAVDHHRRFALVAEEQTDRPPALVGVARYEPLPEPGTVELAVVVQDSWQGQGLGTLLLRELLQAAELNGIRRFRAYVLADNRRMLHVLRRHARVLAQRRDGSVIELTLTSDHHETAEWT
jgi:RimJ/RimL family protein N-acetyltransferase